MQSKAFTSVQFKEMPRPAKMSLIVDCIDTLNSHGRITIDEETITTISSFVSWLLDNID